MVRQYGSRFAEGEIFRELSNIRFGATGSAPIERIPPCFGRNKRRRAVVLLSRRATLRDITFRSSRKVRFFGSVVECARDRVKAAVPSRA